MLSQTTNINDETDLEAELQTLIEQEELDADPLRLSRRCKKDDDKDQDEEADKLEERMTTNAQIDYVIFSQFIKKKRALTEAGTQNSW